MITGLFRDNLIVSKKLISIYGVLPAIYLAELFTFAEPKDGEFPLDRDRISQDTSLSVAQQKEIEKKFSALGIIKVKSDVVVVDQYALLAVFASSEEVQKQAKKLADSFKTPKQTKQEKILENLVNGIVSTNAELREAYTQWIIAIQQKFGAVNSVMVRDAQEKVDNFSKRDLDVALDVIKIATINCYRDMDWAIKAYNTKKYHSSFQNQPSQTTNSAKTTVTREKPTVNINEGQSF